MYLLRCWTEKSVGSPEPPACDALPWPLTLFKALAKDVWMNAQSIDCWNARMTRSRSCQDCRAVMNSVSKLECTKQKKCTFDIVKVCCTLFEKYPNEEGDG